MSRAASSPRLWLRRLLPLGTPPELLRNLRCEIGVGVDPGDDVVGDLVHVEGPGQFDVKAYRPRALA